MGKLEAPGERVIKRYDNRKLYDARAVLEGFAGRECARLRDPDVVHRIGDALTRLKAAAADWRCAGGLHQR